MQLHSNSLSWALLVSCSNAMQITVIDDYSLCMVQLQRRWLQFGAC
jgi:hypothetical protein